jgi:hypothetical protein
MSDASGGTLKQPPMKSKKASTLWAASQQSTSTHQNLSNKMRQSSSKLTCWGSDKKHFFFWCLWSFQHCSNMCHGQRLVYSPIFAMVINPLIGIYNDLYLPTEKGFPYIPIMGWMTPHIPCFDKGTYVLISEMHTVRRKLGAQPKVLLLQADTRRLRWVSTGCCGQ